MTNPDAYKKQAQKFTRALQRNERADFLKNLDEKKETVILLPGGMGSSLWRADQPFSQGRNRYTFEKIWLDWGFLVKPPADGVALEIDKAGYDLRKRLVVAHMGTCFVVRPYVRAMRFFRRNGRRGARLNAFLFAWDWRRNLITTVDALALLITEVKMKVASSKNPKKVMNNVFIVGHSMGGLIAKLFFKRHPRLAAELGGMISVGTPFYGYFGQFLHVYEGNKLFNKVDSYGAKTVAEITASMPGLYTLFPIDLDTYNCVGKRIGLRSYPVTQPDGKTPADPYNQNAPISRWPTWVRGNEIPIALKVRQDIAEDLPRGLQDRVFHIRGNKQKSTYITACWDQKLPPNYDPRKHPSPIKVGQKGTGDGAVPAWSAALACTPPENVKDFATDEHAMMMAQNAILRHILNIVRPGQGSLTEGEFVAEFGPDPQMATSQELDQLLTQVDLTELKTTEQLEILFLEKYAWRFLQDLVT